MPRAIHQLVPSFAPRNAIGNHVLQVQDVIRGMGLDSEIYVADAWREVAHLTRPYRELAGGDGTWLLYQASTGSPLAEWLQGRPEPRLLNYHNITPASLFAPWEPHIGVELAAGRRQLAELAAGTELAIAVSSYNEGELRAAGYRDTAVVPILLDTSTFDRAEDPAAVERLQAPGPVWLFVGRLAPNKAQHDLLKALSVYRRVYDPTARLRLVGGSSSHAYATAVKTFVRALQMEDAVEFCGDVSDAELAAHYRAADVFVSTSEHEGFCIPLLEAMHHRLPIVAYGSSAVPETLGSAGLCLRTKEPTRVAAAAHRVITDPAVRAALVAAGTARLADFDLDRNRRRMADALAGAVGA
ncbi:MAG: hexosyltransferase [Acidimicrobiales bacterium]|nr:hexosyltransferase [Acidimicrobiales bacterium]